MEEDNKVTAPPARRVPRAGIPHPIVDKFSIEHQFVATIKGTARGVGFTIFFARDLDGYLIPDQFFLAIPPNPQTPPYNAGNKVNPDFIGRMARDAEALNYLSSAMSYNKAGTDYVRSYHEIMEFFKNDNVIADGTYEDMGYANPPVVPDAAIPLPPEKTKSRNYTNGKE